MLNLATIRSSGGRREKAGGRSLRRAGKGEFETWNTYLIGRRAATIAFVVASSRVPREGRRLERYAQLDPEIVRAIGADEMPPLVICISENNG